MKNEETMFDCLNPQGHDVEYVSENMAIDAGDRAMAGSIYREAEWHRCGECAVCVLQQKLSQAEARVKFLESELDKK